jgi:glutathione S-transferase
MTKARLTTFRISHFSEKARWAFDWSGLEYVERALLPGVHVPFVRRIAPRTTVPVLEHHGRVIQGSGAILDYLEDELGAKALAAPPAMAARGAELERLADRAFGLGIQRIFYDAFLDRPKDVTDVWSQQGPAWGRPFYAIARPFIVRQVRRLYRITPDVVESAKDAFRRAFDETDRILESSPYLLGDRPSRADVTVAALLAPACRPPEHVVRWPTAVPERLVGFLHEHESRPTFNWVLRMYREHRRSRQQ